MKLLTFSNLFPRRDRPQCGLFNLQLFREFARILGPDALRNLCLVPEWRVWRWPAIARWGAPSGIDLDTRYVPAAYLPVVGRDVNWMAYVASLRRYRSAFASADCVYAAWLYPDGVAAVRLAADAGKPAWIMVQGSDTFHLRSSLRRRVIAAACRDAAGLVCVSDELAARLIDAGVDPGKVHVVANGVDTGRFHYRNRAEVRARLSLSRYGVDAAAPIVLFVGNLAPVKAPEVLLRAGAVLRDRATRNNQRPTSNIQQTGTHGGQPYFVLIGEGKLRARLERMAQDLGMTDRVRWIGSCPHEEIARWMNAADVLCLTSRSEGMPNVIREALACGLPVVATDVGACRQMLADEPHARVAPPSDAAAMATAISDLLSSLVDRERLSHRHRDWTWHDQAQQILQLVESRPTGGSLCPPVPRQADGTRSPALPCAPLRFAPGKRVLQGMTVIRL